MNFSLFSRNWYILENKEIEHEEEKNFENSHKFKLS